MPGGQQIADLATAAFNPKSHVRGAPHQAERRRLLARVPLLLLRLGLTVSQVVHDYGDICQAVTELAVAQNPPIRTDSNARRQNDPQRPLFRRVPTNIREYAKKCPSELCRNCVRSPRKL